MRPAHDTELIDRQIGKTRTNIALRKYADSRPSRDVENMACDIPLNKFQMETSKQFEPKHHDPKTCRVHRCGLCAVAGKDK